MEHVGANPVGDIWYCKIGQAKPIVEQGADAPMRELVTVLYRTLTGKEPNFCFSGWQGELTAEEKAVVDGQEPGYKSPLPEPLFLPDGTIIEIKMISDHELAIVVDDPDSETRPEIVWSKDYEIHNA